MYALPINCVDNPANAVQSWIISHVGRFFEGKEKQIIDH
jgi:hypothetical protein